MNKEHTYAAQMELTNIPEDSLKQWTNMPPISEELYDGGWQSVTTKSRLNALCYEFATGFSVFQKNWDWFVSDFQNKTIKPFVDGITVNYNGCF